MMVKEGLCYLRGATKREHRSVRRDAQRERERNGHTVNLPSHHRAAWVLLRGHILSRVLTRLEQFRAPHRVLATVLGDRERKEKVSQGKRECAHGYLPLIGRCWRAWNQYVINLLPPLPQQREEGDISMSHVGSHTAKAKEKNEFTQKGLLVSMLPGRGYSPHYIWAHVDCLTRGRTAVLVKHTMSPSLYLH